MLRHYYQRVLHINMRPNRSTTGLSDYLIGWKISQITMKHISSVGICSCVLAFSMTRNPTLGFFVRRGCILRNYFPLALHQSSAVGNSLTSSLLRTLATVNVLIRDVLLPTFWTQNAIQDPLLDDAASLLVGNSDHPCFLDSRAEQDHLYPRFPRQQYQRQIMFLFAFLALNPLGVDVFLW